MADDRVPTAAVRGAAPVFEGDSADPPPDMTVVPTYRLYSPGQISGATFLGTPLAATWLLATNYRRLREPAKARNTLILGLLGTLGFLAVGFALGRSTHGRAPWLAIASVAAMSAIAKALQGEAFASHTARGGKVASTWRAVGVGAVGLAIVVGAVFAYVFSMQPSKVDFGDSEVYYADGGNRTEAKAVGAALTDLGYIESGRRVSVEVVHDRGRPVVGFVTQDVAFHDEALQAEFHEMASVLSARAFGGGPVDIWLIDEDRAPRVKLSWEQRPTLVDLGDGHTVSCRSGCQEPEARAVGQVLVDHHYFAAGHPASVYVQRSGGRAVVMFLVASIVFDEPQRQPRYHAYAAWFSAAAFDGAPVDIWLADAKVEVHQRLTWETRSQTAEAP